LNSLRDIAQKFWTIDNKKGLPPPIGMGSLPQEGCEISDVMLHLLSGWGCVCLLEQNVMFPCPSLGPTLVGPNEKVAKVFWELRIADVVLCGTELWTVFEPVMVNAETVQSVI
jgi:hypothetical protein